MAASPQKVSESTVRRLSLYLRFLEEFEEKGVTTVSSEELAGRGGTTAAQVRKDLSIFGSFGKRGLGYAVPLLGREIRRILGLSRSWRVALVGAGRIGAALFEYPNFRTRGFRIVTVLDHDPKKVGRLWDGTRIRHVDTLEETLRETKVDIAILAVPEEVVQDVVDRVVSVEIKAILNFAPTQLRVPNDVVVNDVNMAMELEALSFALVNRALR